MKNNAMPSLFFLFLLMLVMTLSVLFEPYDHIGCHVVGTEINGDYSTEYLLMGNC